MVSVALEKQQVAALAERVDELLDQVLDERLLGDARPRRGPADLDDQAPLEQPIEEEFRAGTMTLSWDPAIERVVIEVFPFTDEVVVERPESRRGASRSPSPTRCCLVRITPGAARAFALRAGRVVEAGRPAAPSAAVRSTRGPPVRAGQRLPPPRPGLSEP